MENVISLDLNDFSLFRKLPGPKIQHIDPLSIILPQMDFMKDIILVVRMITLLGGIVVFTNPQLFSSNVSELDLALSKCFSFDYAFALFFPGDLPFIRNYLYPSIFRNIKLCNLESSRPQ